MPVEITTTVDTIDCRVYNGPGRWLEAFFSSLFLMSGTASMALGTVLPVVLLEHGNNGWAFAAAILAVPWFIGVAHFTMGLTGVRDSLVETQFTATLGKLTLQRSIVGVLPYWTHELPLGEAMIIANGAEFIVYDDTGADILTLDIGADSELNGFGTLLSSACDAAMLEAGGEAPKALDDLLRRPRDTSEQPQS